MAVIAKDNGRQDVCVFRRSGWFEGTVLVSRPTIEVTGGAGILYVTERRRREHNAAHRGLGTTVCAQDFFQLGFGTRTTTQRAFQLTAM